MSNNRGNYSNLYSSMLRLIFKQQKNGFAKYEIGSIDLILYIDFRYFWDIKINCVHEMRHYWDDTGIS